MLRLVRMSKNQSDMLLTYIYQNLTLFIRRVNLRPLKVVMKSDTQTQMILSGQYLAR